MAGDCAGDEIFADDSSIVGSIGVVSSGFGFQELIKRHGVERRLHTAGDKKTLLDPFKEEDPKEVARLKTIQKEMHQTFIETVKARRGRAPQGQRQGAFQRRVLDRPQGPGPGPWSTASAICARSCASATATRSC